jgi:hypothetical protein
MSKAPDALRALQDAKRASMALAKKKAEEEPPPPQVDDDEAACFVHIAIAAYRDGVVMGLGAMPDGSALWLRLRFPTTSSDPRAGLVAFCVGDDTLAILQKAVAALETPTAGRWWKPDKFAAQRAAK